MLLPYAGQNRCTLVKLLKHLKKILPSDVKTDIVYTWCKLSCKFNVRDKTPFEKQHDLPYSAVCATNNCAEDYAGETARRIDGRAKDHNSRDQNSHLIEHTIKNNHLLVVKVNVTILDISNRNNKCKRKIAEKLMVKVIRPSLNGKEKSVELKLLSWMSTRHTNVCLYTRSIAFNVGLVQICQQRYHSYVLYSCFGVLINFG